MPGVMISTNRNEQFANELMDTNLIKKTTVSTTKNSWCDTQLVLTYCLHPSLSYILLSHKNHNSPFQIPNTDMMHQILICPLISEDEPTTKDIQSFLYLLV